MGAWVLWDALSETFKVLPWMFLIVVGFTVICLVIMTIVIGGTFLLVTIGGLISDIREKLKSPEQKKRDKRALAKRIEKEKEDNKKMPRSDTKRTKQEREEEREIECSDAFERGLEDGERGSPEGYYAALKYCTRKRHINRETYAYCDGYMLGYQT